MEEVIHVVVIGREGRKDEEVTLVFKLGWWLYYKFI